MLKSLTIAGVSALIAATGATAATAAIAHSDSQRVEFYKVTQDVGTNGIQRFIIKGKGCLKTEDATKLRLVDYAPSEHKVIYRCVKP